MGSSWYLLPPDEDGEDRLDYRSLLRGFVVRLHSRKFLAAVLGSVAMLVAGNKTEAAAIISAYIVGEAYIDSKAV